MKQQTFLSIGKIVGVHGIRGVVKVRSYAESPFIIFKAGTPILLQTPDGERKTYVIETSQPHQKHVLLSFKEINDRNTAETLVGCEFLIERSSLPKLEEDTYYWADLIGMSVFADDGRFIGKIDSIFATGSNDVYVVKNRSTETLIPAIASVVVMIDVEENTMRVVLPEGIE